MVVRYALAFCIAFLSLASVSAAESLNVFSEYNYSSIYINDQFAGVGAVRNYELPPGDHFVKVVRDGRTIYSKVIYIAPNESRSVVVDNFVTATSPLPNRGSLLAEANRAMESRGNLGFGVNMGVIPGISLKWRILDQLTLNGVGFWASSGDSHYSSWEGRLHYNMVNTLIGKMPATAYLSLGYGQMDDQSSRVQQFEMTELALGMELSLHPFLSQNKSSSGNLFTQILHGLFALENAYFNLELGVGSINHQEGDDYSGILGRAGFHYYF